MVDRDKKPNRNPNLIELNLENVEEGDIIRIKYNNKRIKSLRVCYSETSVTPELTMVEMYDWIK